MTKQTRIVLDLLIRAQDEGTPMWGLRICDLADLGSGTVYPILERLEKAGWVTANDEEGYPAGRPKRRFYTVTDAGRGHYEAAEAARVARRARWLPTRSAGARLGGGDVSA